MKKSTKLFATGGTVLLIVGAIIGGIVYSSSSSSSESDNAENLQLSWARKIALKVLTQTPIIDGHNDFPWNVRNFIFNDLAQVNFNSLLNETEPWASSPNSHTDIPRLREGHVGAQFWVAFTGCSGQYQDAVEQTFEQIDVIRRLAAQYTDDLQFATSVADIEDAIAKNKIASLIGVEGGHSIQSSFGILRTMYDLGVRYMTLTHSCNTPWADSSPVDALNATIFADNNGLSAFGIKIVHEMNRLGMMVDLSHVSHATMVSGLQNSKAPVIFSHSSAYALCNHHRNVQDDVLRLVKEKNSLVMVNFYSYFIQCDSSKNATLQDVLQHIDYIRNITGPDHVGIGGDYDGIEKPPEGLEDVSKYPDLFEALAETGRWSVSDLEKLAGKNLLRVFGEVERVKESLKNSEPIQETMTRAEFEEHGGNSSCITAKRPDDVQAKATNVRKRRDTTEDSPEL